ncbi:MAG: RagB/SusD family nutrient uptake outer membrane protein [Saprospiraceae bacterium]|nr:RagB/SusD family nutrient uptake outer membrane protein [Saprospiraceae bacterium]
MRKNQILFIFLTALYGLSCTGILDKEPIGILDAGSFFKTEKDALQAVNAAYQPLMFCSSNNNFYWAFGVLASDEAVVGGDGSRPGLTELDFLTQTSRTEELNNFWKLEYKGINQCNTVLDRVPGIDMDVALKDRILGEAHFLRAFYYFQLTQVFGDVPLYTKITPPEELKIPRTPVADIYKLIIDDCEKAALSLPVSYDASQVGRATKGAALALAAKTQLYAKNYTAVLSYIDQIKALGVYALMPDYEDNFRKNTQNNSESVWEIQHTNLELGVGNSLNQYWSSKKIPNGYGFCEVTPEYVAEFEPGDPRRQFTVASNNEDYFGHIYKNSYSSTKYSPRKYLQADSTLTQKADGDINVTNIRYAEILLWEAEALTELGRVEEAQVPLEQVRARARNQSADPANTLPEVKVTDKLAMLEAIRHERSVELGFEMHRFFDLVRWGIASEKIPGFQKNKNELFPLPQVELDLNPFLTQNLNY